MAYATLLSVTQSLEQNLHSNDQSLVPHETEQRIMWSLYEKASFLLSFLENDSLKYRESTLEPRIRDVSYETETMIEHDFPHQNYKGSRKIVEELNSILEEVEKMKGNQVEDLRPTKSLPTASIASGSTDKTHTVGLREQMIMEIKDRLTGSPSRREIISIVGMAGIGKTTLARTIHDDPLTVRHFDVRAWITVSRDYHRQQMLTGLLNSIQNISHGSYPEDLAHHLYKTLKKRRYLIVMDDVWDINAWDLVKRYFPDDNNGSRVILTTRLQDVAHHVECPDSIYSPSLLSPDDSWKLLRQKAFEAQHFPPELEDVGKEIANNCKGLPLSLVVIGGMLCKAERTLDYWRYVAQNVNSALTNANDQVMEILSLSYKHLPHYLRACFLYMTVFPEYHAIPKSKLIRFWVAEGFIKPSPSKSLEEVALEYLKNLISRNMIFVSEYNYAGGIKKCGIHDLLRDLCTRIAQEEKFLKVVCSQLEIPHDSVYNFRHIYICSDSRNCLIGIRGCLRNPILYLPTETQNSDLVSRALSSDRMRVLDVIETQVEILDPTLRYISFDYWGGRYEFPSSISKLLNLQTLTVASYVDKVMLPLEFWMLPRLRHIRTRECFLPDPFDAQNGRDFVPMENLQTLKGVTNFRFSEDAIQMIPNLKKLGIKFDLEGGSDLSSYCIGNLVLLRQLEALAVSLVGDTKYPLPENFNLPPNLKKLSLHGLRLSPENMASIGSMQHLEQLNLNSISFDASVWEPTEGEFLQLKSLSIFHADLEYLTADETNFPILQSLRISFCDKLKEIPSAIGYIGTLRLIDVSECTKSVEDSMELLRNEQEDLENNRLQIVFKSSGILSRHVRLLDTLPVIASMDRSHPLRQWLASLQSEFREL